MLASDKAACEAEMQAIRHALKAWETAWAQAHGGAKPGRDDIRANPDIAQKYKSYNRFRDLLAGKAEPDTEPKALATYDTKDKETKNAKNARERKRKPAETASHETPAKRRVLDSLDTLDAETPTISRKLFSPAAPTSIGPTPQRDGRVLGLFDVLDTYAAHVEATPSRRTSAARTLATDSVLGTTPRKQKLLDVPVDSDDDIDDSDDSDDSNDENHGRRHGRTPMSSGRRHLLNHFAEGVPKFAVGARARDARHSSDTPRELGTTPLAPRDGNAARPMFVTPSKHGATADVDATAVEFATPAFLRRTSAAAGDAAAVPKMDFDFGCRSPPSKRLPRKPLVRGLSAVLASLRKAEDERLDEELAVLREVEEDEDARANAKAQAKTTLTGPEDDAAIEAELADLDQLEAFEAELASVQHETAPRDTHAETRPRLLGGFDDEGLYDSDPEANAGMDRGQPLRVYKKKGQKRTTRLFNMRPVRTQRGGTANLADAPVDYDSDEAVPATGDDDDDKENAHYGSDLDYDGTSTKTKTKKGKGKDKGKDNSKSKDKEGLVQKVARTINGNAQKYANFRRLNIKSKGGSGKGRFGGGRFGRRR